MKPSCILTIASKIIFCLQTNTHKTQQKQQKTSPFPKKIIRNLHVEEDTWTYYKSKHKFIQMNFQTYLTLFMSDKCHMYVQKYISVQVCLFHSSIIIITICRIASRMSRCRTVRNSEKRHRLREKVSSCLICFRTMDRTNRAGEPVPRLLQENIIKTNTQTQRNYSKNLQIKHQKIMQDE